jgi:hypothetical protein
VSTGPGKVHGTRTIVVMIKKLFSIWAAPPTSAEGPHRE